MEQLEQRLIGQVIPLHADCIIASLFCFFDDMRLNGFAAWLNCLEALEYKVNKLWN